MKKFAIDSNIIDAIANCPGFIEKLQVAVTQQRLQLLVTHVQRDEIMEITTEHRRLELLAVYNSLPKQEIPTHDFVIGRSRLDMARLSDGLDYEKYVDGGTREKHSEDALIGITALHEADILVTNESLTKRNRLPSRLNRVKVDFEVWGFERFEDFVEGEVDDLADDTQTLS